ncbi:rhodopsin, GQ-coupled-like [Ylistrum balloti]|uniref:rhodopsin, GQ-coupled-like n=1 Tax=Ylistrum balloti TaxID=509963 RepID=UPI0029058181|nr:rhodopsin, GQ-coupled-like [Ylistrum balloti]
MTEFQFVLISISLVWMFYRFRSLRNSSNFLVLNLSIADLMMAIGNLPAFAVASFNMRWVFSNIGCQLYGFIGSLASLASITTLTLIAIERSIVIVHQLPWYKKTSVRTVLLFVVFSWLYSAFWSIAPLLGWGRYILEGSQASCTFDFISQQTRYRSFSISLMTGCFFIPLVIIFVCYISIFLKVALHEREIDQLTMTHNSKLYFPNISRERRKQKREFKTAKIAFGIILVFCFSWLPYAVFAMIGSFGGDLQLVTPLAVSVIGLCAKIATAVNPILYALIHPKYRGKVSKDMKMGMSYVFKNANSQHSRITHSITNDSNEELQLAKFSRKESMTSLPENLILVQNTINML